MGRVTRPFAPRILLVLLLAVAFVATLVLGGVQPHEASAAETAPLKYVPLDRISQLASLSMTAGQTQTVQATGTAWIPADAKAVLLDVTVSHGTAPSTFLTLWGSGLRPGTSNINAEAEKTTQNTAVVQLSDAGTLQIYNNSGSITAALNPMGYFVVDDGSATAGFVAKNPVRVLDTRNTAAVPAGGTLDIQVAGVAGVPADASAVFVNLIAVTPTVSGSVTITQRGLSPGGAGPTYTAGGSVAQAVSVKPDMSGWATIKNFQASGSIHVLLDIQGYFTSDPTTAEPFRPTTARVYDSRKPGMTPIAPGETRNIELGCVSGLPAGGMTAVFANVTVISPPTNGALRVWSPEETEPSVNNVIFTAGATHATLLATKVSSEGEIVVRNPLSTQALNFYIDVQGWFGPTGADVSEQSETTIDEIRYFYKHDGALDGLTNVTSTSTGLQALADLRTRVQANMEVELDTTGYKVYDASGRNDPGAPDPAPEDVEPSDNVQSSILILPPGEDLVSETASSDGENRFICTAVEVTTDPNEVGGYFLPDEEGSTATSSSKHVHKDICRSRKEDSAFWFDTCYRWVHIHNDGSGSTDYYAFRDEGTCKSKWWAELHVCRLGNKRKAGTPALDWGGVGSWKPNQDLTGVNCGTSIGLSVTIGPFTVGETYQGCDRYDITKYEAAPKFKNAWGNYGGVHSSERHVGYQVGMKVGQGKGPRLIANWAVGWSTW